jgi:hypothetical protein
MCRPLSTMLPQPCIRALLIPTPQNRQQSPTITRNHGYSLISVLGIIDGGTWEHRKRAREMLETAQKNNLQSIAGRGNHFMGDFLPVSTGARM